MATKMDVCKDKKPLNTGTNPSTKAIKGVELSERLRKSMQKLKGKFISADGKLVDYVKMKESKEFQDYLKDASDLQVIDLTTMSEIERKVFFINTYNCLTIHGLAEQPKPPESVLKVQQFFKTTCYNIGGLCFSLDDIEHGVLRSNKPHPASTKAPLSPEDPKLKFACKTLDPRIHFALVCGAKSCPALSVYTVENLDTALTAATKSFCGQEVLFNNDKNEIQISKLFLWYRNDFGATDVDVLKWILPYLSEKEQDQFGMLIMKLEMVGSVSLRYTDYNWSLNMS